MIRYVLGLILILVIQTASGHDPNLATFVISHRKGVWLVEMSCSQAALHKSITHKHPELENEGFNSKQYKEAVIEYLKGSISITANSFGKVSLGQGGIRLGDHQSDAKFELIGMPIELHELHVELRTMVENGNHTNALKVKLEDHTEKFLLTKRNNYQITMVKTR